MCGVTTTPGQWPAAGPDVRAILHPGAAARRFTLHTHPCSPRLAQFADYVWVVEWDLAPGESHVQRVLASASVHLSVGPDEAMITGLQKRATFAKELRGRGRVLGLRWRAGGFRPLYGGRISELTDRRPPMAELLRVDVGSWQATVQDAADSAGAAQSLVDYLEPLLPAPDPMVDVVADVVEEIRADPKLIRVDDVAARHDMSVRRLQRLFTEYVGAGPKWVIRTHRLLEVSGRAAAGDPVDWAELAAELGYSDQAHLIREFTRVVGAPPARYAREQREAGGLRLSQR